MRLLTTLRVSSVAGAKARGRLTAGSIAIPCALGPAGVRADKREGDGATPRGRFALAGWFFRADQFRGPVRGAAIRRNAGWCDDPASSQYNRPVRLPFAASHERLWREDHCYDIIGILNHNARLRIKGRGSAVFFHISHDDLRPTAGCVAIRAADMRRLLPRLAKKCVLRIGV